MDERQLLAAIHEGDRGAAEILVERTYAAVHAWLFRLTGGDSDLAADLTQETYRKAWSALSGFGGRSQITTWLFRIAYTTFLNQKRRLALVPLPDGSPESPDPDVLPDEELSRSQMSEHLRRAVIGLPEDLRFAVTARFWADLSVKEIARVEGVTAAAIRKRLRKALAHLESRLSEEVT